MLNEIILGVVQGLTEWFPVSSSGHLVLMHNILGFKTDVFFDILLHLGTLLVVLLVFYKDILRILKAVFRLDFKSEYGKLAIFVFIGSLITGAIGYFFYDFFIGMFNNLKMVGVAFLITGGLLFFSESRSGKNDINYKSSILIGLMQGIALIPGISRSGATISAGLLLGIDRKKVARFSFLMLVPAVIGALLFEIRKVSLVNYDFLALGLGFLASVIVGYASLKGLLFIIKKSKFRYFSYYCFIIGIITLIL